MTTSSSCSMILASKSKTPPCGVKREVVTETPAWLGVLMETDYTIGCLTHDTTPRNDLTRFCIDCKSPVCLNCVTSEHYQHRLLKIYRNSKKEAVPLDDLQKHLDCSEIQVYRCNMQSVISITPLANGRTNNLQPPCKTCMRKLIDHLHFTYCSLSCKVKAFEHKSDDSRPPFLLLQVEEPSKKRHRRKGIPHRSPSH